MSDPQRATREPQEDRNPKTPSHASDEDTATKGDGDATGISSVDRQTPGTPEETEIHDSIDLVTQSFHWLSDAAQQRVETLRKDLEKVDEPEWSSELLEAVLEVAIAAGSLGIGKFLAEKLVGHAGEVTKSFVEGLFGEGTKAGVMAGARKLQQHRGGDVIDAFVDGQLEAISATHNANQTKWIKAGRKKIRTAREAQSLEDACSRDNVRAAAEAQYRASRDAWVCYLAQSRFGAVDKQGPVTKDSVNVGPTRTDMSTQVQRDRDAREAPGFRDVVDAPDFDDAVSGRAAGVLEVVAKLPKIVPAVPGANITNVMLGQPSVEIALLNGVNDVVREQYAGTPLAELRIPRQVQAHVDGAPDFALNLDEQGNCNLLTHAQATWLRNRATVDHPENTRMSEYEKQQQGRQLLLEELVPEHIIKQFK